MCCFPLERSPRDLHCSSLPLAYLAISSALLNLEHTLTGQPTCLDTSVLVHFHTFWHGAVLLEGLVAEEVLTQEAAAQLLQEAQYIPNAVHCQQVQEVLLPLKKCWDWKGNKSSSIPSKVWLFIIWEQGRFHTNICLHVSKYFTQSPHLKSKTDYKSLRTWIHVTQITFPWEHWKCSLAWMVVQGYLREASNWKLLYMIKSRQLQCNSQSSKENEKMRIKDVAVNRIKGTRVLLRSGLPD